ncbi:iron chelate uptake ABC transporter family permease subunit [Granulicoccus phenolivorans]|uniref:iron chelate uptake ABC transporter family permease subunit n=1 Tax=Granulicoccus phenolivorans TaxID=266854 RepID=UPI00041FDFAA|nr:iron chelate uptake ABC transporter family permease subunit [Granulicoccus phenolivorans]
MSSPASRAGMSGRTTQDPAATAPPRRLLALLGSPPARLVLFALLALACAAAYYLINANGNINFVLTYRSQKVAAMVLVGIAVAISTVLFQTITANRILTPSIMGFDSLYALLQTVLVFVTSAFGVGTLSSAMNFGLSAVLMVISSTALFLWLFGGPRRSLYLMVLVGIIFGTLLRSLATLLQRIMEPNSFLTLQSRLFASFTNADPALLPIAAVLVVAVSLVIWLRSDELDVLALGRELATMLGVNYRRTVLIGLVGMAVLVSVSTALVGPITFFGLIVANLAYQLAGTHRHRYVLPVAALLSIITLVGAQAVLEHLFGMGTVLSVIIEFVGGIVFIVLLLRNGRQR